MVIEAGVVAGYVIAWAVRKARRVGGRLDAEADGVIDANLDRLHAVVTAKLRGHAALADLVEEAETAGDGGEVSDPVRQKVASAITEAAAQDDVFGQVMTDLVARLRATEQAAGNLVIAGPGSAVFTGPAEAKASGGGIAFSQVAGGVHISQGTAGPS
jgi:hypothetical protein